MGRELRAAHNLLGLCLGGLLWISPPAEASAQEPQLPIEGPTPAPLSTKPAEITADRLEYRQETELYEAAGSVVFVQGQTKLTADHVTLRMLTGRMVATGRVHLSKGDQDVWADRLELNINTEAGIIVNGQLLDRATNTLITASRFQRVSEDHYRAADGSFTNCDAMEGQTPAWRFTFEDADVHLGDSVSLRNAWLCVGDIPVLPIPALDYPVGVRRKTGLLLPTPGYGSEFGFTYRQGFFWAINPSHDATITPYVFGDRGYGSDLEYRYALGRQNRGQWLLNAFRDTEEDRTRSIASGSHMTQVNEDLLVRAKAFVVSDRTYLQDIAHSGLHRALSSADSYLDVRQRLRHGGAYLRGEFLQPLAAGGDSTFQRLPELGLGFADVAPLDAPLLLGLQGTFVNFFREEGFDFHRADIMPTLTTGPLIFGNVMSVTPQFRPRAAYYSRGVASDKAESRETFWTSLRMDSTLTRRFRHGPNGMVLHTIEPNVIYEFVPPTDQGNIIQVDDVDDLPKKSLLTYMLDSRLLHVGSQHKSSNWLDLTVAQSYRLGAAQTEARLFPFPGDPAFGTVTQPLRPPTTAVTGKKFSDVWIRATLGQEDLRPIGAMPTSRFLTVDTMFDSYNSRFRQVNTDLRFQQGTHWYAQVGHRYTRAGNRVRRGDIWNPLSFGEVFAPTPKVSFITGSGAIRMPMGVTLGGRVLHDFETGQTTEYDVVGLYQNPCRCWSLGLYFIKFPDRSQVSFLINLTGIGNTNSFGSRLLESLLSPLLQGERGLPW